LALSFNLFKILCRVDPREIFTIFIGFSCSNKTSKETEIELNFGAKITNLLKKKKAEKIVFEFGAKITKLLKKEKGGKILFEFGAKITNLLKKEKGGKDCI
jgi:hypothetical protein